MSIVDRLKAAGSALLGGAPGPPAPPSGATSQPAQVPGLTPIITPTTNVGNPVVKRIINSAEALFGRVSYAAGPSPSRYSTYPADGINPEIIYACFRTADQGYPRLQAELYEQVTERDAHIRGVAKARTYEVSGKEFRLKPKDDTPLASALAKFVRACLDEIDGLDSSIGDLLSAEGAGYAVTESIYDFRRVRFHADDGKPVTMTVCTPTQLSYVHGKHFEFDLLTDQPYIVISGTRQVLPEGKFVFHSADGPGMIERRGYMRPCVTLHAAKVWSLRNWILEGELFSIPQLTGSYPNGMEEYEAQRGAFQKILRDWGKGVPAWIPDEVKFEVTTAQRNNASGIQAAIIGHANTEISKLVQGETLTTEIGNAGAFAATETHADVRHAFIVADARRLATCLREQLIRPIIKLNIDALADALGASPEEIMRAVPLMYWRIDRETSPAQRASIMLDFVTRGNLQIDEDQVRDEFALDAPRPGGKALESSEAKLQDAQAKAEHADAVKKEAEAVKAHADATKADAAAGALDGTAAEPASGTPARVELTATDIATIVTVNEARASQGLPPMEGDDGKLTVAEFKAKHAGPIAEAAQAEAGHDTTNTPTE